MKAKEKAKEIVDKMNMKQKPSLNSSTNSFNINDTIYNAKQCALIAVESSKEAAVYTVVDYKEVDESEWVHFKGYWQEVKQEIEKL